MPSWRKVITSGSNASLSSLVVTGGITGSLQGTASFANTASFVTASNVYGPYGSNSIVSASYAVSSSYTTFAETASSATNAQDILIRVLNQSGNSISKGLVVHITASDNSSDIPRIITASFENDNNSANTLGVAYETIANGSEGYVITEGVLRGIDTSAFTSGQLIYLGATGSIIGTAPVAPLHGVRLGQVIRVQSNQGSIYVRVDNGYELEELHDVLIVSASAGDLLVRDGNVWNNSKQLTGSYALTGSLIVTGSTSGDLLRITQTGTGNAFVVEDNTNPDSTPFVIDASGSVGIGVSTVIPTSKLQVNFNGDERIILNQTSASSNYGIQYRFNGTRTWDIYSAGSNGASLAVFSQVLNSNLITLTSAGNVGIGTTSPSNKLTIQDTLGDSLRISVTDDTKFNRTLFQKPSQTWSAGASDINDFVIGDENAVVYRLRIQSGSANWLINPNGTGSVSIGTPTTSAKLHINNTTPSASFLVEDSTNPDSTPFVIDASGSVGIGTSSPTALLHISSSTASILTVERSINANAHIQYKNVATSMWAGLAPTIPNGYFGIGSTIDLVSASFVVMSGSGNVGIGTTSPTAKLDVVGNTIITGSLNVTAGITGSLFGTASWAQNAATSSYVLNAVSSSFASTASFLNTLNQDLTFNGNLTLNGTASISFLNVTFESASVIYSSGSNQLGDATNDTQTLIGTTVLSGSLQLTGSANLPSITGSLLGTASYAVNADTASVANLALSVGTLNQVLIVSGSSTAGTSLVRITQTGTGNAFLVEDEANVDSTPFVIDTDGNVGIGTTTPTAKLDVIGNANISGSLSVTGVVNANLTGSVFGTSSWAQNAVTASYVLNAVSASFASTASFVNTLRQDVIISGSLQVSGSIAATQNITASRALISSSNGTVSGSTLTVYGSGSARPVFTVQGSQGELFSVTDSLSGSLFSVNDISGLPILEVFSDNTTLIGSYQDPMLITTTRLVTTASGAFNIYSLPTASYDTAFYEYSIRSGSNARAGSIMAIQSGTSVNFTETTTTDFGSTSGFAFTVLVSGANIILTGSATTSGWTIKTIVRSI